MVEYLQANLSPAHEVASIEAGQKFCKNRTSRRCAGRHVGCVTEKASTSNDSFSLFAREVLLEAVVPVSSHAERGTSHSYLDALQTMTYRQCVESSRHPR